MKWGLCIHGETGYVFHVLHSESNASTYILVTYSVDIYVEVDVTRKSLDQKSKVYHSFEYVHIQLYNM